MDNKKSRGFTIVELLIVIVVIGILAAIVIVAYGAVQDRARHAKIDSDTKQISKAIMAARVLTGKSMREMTGSDGTASDCIHEPDGTNLATLDHATDPCWVAYNLALKNFQTASGIGLTGIVDPWGQPYYIDENEGEFPLPGYCWMDIIGTFKRPHIQDDWGNRDNELYVPNSLPGCSDGNPT